MLKNLTTTDATISFKLPATISGGVFTLVSVGNSKVKANNKNIILGDIEFSFTGGTATGLTAIQTGTLVGTAIVPSTEKITPTSSKVHSGNDYAVLEGDYGSFTLWGYTTNTPPVATSITATIEVSDSGQTKVKGQ